MDADANNPHYLTTAKYIGKHKSNIILHLWLQCNKNAIISK